MYIIGTVILIVALFWKPVYWAVRIIREESVEKDAAYAAKIKQHFAWLKAIIFPTGDWK